MAGLQTRRTASCRTTMCGPWPSAAMGPSGSGPPAAWPATTRDRWQVFKQQNGELPEGRLWGALALGGDGAFLGRGLRPWPGPLPPGADGRPSTRRNSRPAGRPCAGPGRRRDGAVWVGTATARYHQGLWQAFKKENSGLPDDHVSDLAVGPRRGRLGRDRRRRPSPLPPGPMAGLQTRRTAGLPGDAVGPGRRPATGPSGSGPYGGLARFFPSDHTSQSSLS